jgi:hypothetical protein
VILLEVLDENHEMTEVRFVFLPGLGPRSPCSGCHTPCANGGQSPVDVWGSHQGNVESVAVPWMQLVLWLVGAPHMGES